MMNQRRPPTSKIIKDPTDHSKFHYFESNFVLTNYSVPVYDLSGQNFNLTSDFFNVHNLGVELQNSEAPLGEPILATFYLTKWKKGEKINVDFNLQWVARLVHP